MNIFEELSKGKISIINKHRIKIDIIYLIGFFCTFYIASLLGSIAYLYPYIDIDITGFFVIFLLGYYVLGFLVGFITTDSGRAAFKYIHTTLLGGMVLFLVYLIPFKANFTNDTADKAYHSILNKMGLDKDKSQIPHTNKDIDDIFEAYKNKDISKLAYFESNIDNVLKIKDETFAQLIVNVKVLNNKLITELYNKSLEDKRISVNEYKEIIKLIVSEEVK